MEAVEVHDFVCDVSEAECRCGLRQIEPLSDIPFAGALSRNAEPWIVWQVGRGPTDYR